jgi:hypothetical protein
LAGDGHPVLQLHELGLEPEELPEIGLSGEPAFCSALADLLGAGLTLAILDLEFELLVEVVAQLLVQARDQFGGGDLVFTVGL